MTSPTQLKYLEAMGIPVWVSRDLVSFDQVVKEEYVEVNLQSLPNTRINSEKRPNQDNSSARRILDSLDKSPEVSTAPINKVRSTNIKDVVADSVLKAQLSTEPASGKPSLIPSNKTNTKNLLFKTQQHYVFASGDEAADWMIIGHSPESFNGIGYEPFAGEAGELLNNMMTAVGFEKPRQQTFMINILDVNQVSDEPSNKEIKVELHQKLTSIIHKNKPKLVLVVGQIAAQNLLQSEDPLIVLRSKAYQLTDDKIPCVVTYYPSYLLQKPIDKRKAWNDLKLAMSLLTDVS